MNIEQALPDNNNSSSSDNNNNNNRQPDLERLTQRQHVMQQQHHHHRNIDNNNNGGRRSTKHRVSRFGDDNFTVETIDDFDEAEWGEVLRSCCIRRSKKEYRDALLGSLLILILAYFYIFGLVLLGEGAKVLSGCRVGELFSEGIIEINPLSGVMLGCLATALIQSSSTTIAIIITLVGSKSINVENATYLVMGANIGTTITNDIVAMGMIKDGKNLERAFSGAVLHDLFNILTVGILLPLEAATGYLQVVTKLIVEGIETTDNTVFNGPVEWWVEPLVNKLIIANKNAIINVSEGGDDDTTCTSLYPTQCENNGIIDYDSCKGHFGFIQCNESTNECPALFFNDVQLRTDQIAGGICVFMALFIMYICLLCLTITIQRLLHGFSTRVVYKVTNFNGYINIVIGTGITILLQSSSITTSIFTPLVGIGVIRYEQMLPLTLGANLGTTFSTGVVALNSHGLDQLQVALIHLFFNITGCLIWFPIPRMRKVIIYAAQRVGYCANVFRLFPVIPYIIIVYFIGPMILLLLSNLYMNGTQNEIIGAIIITILLVILIISIIYFCKYQDGGNKLEDFVNTYLTFSSSSINHHHDNYHNNRTNRSDPITTPTRGNYYDENDNSNNNKDNESMQSNNDSLNDDDEEEEERRPIINEQANTMPTPPHSEEIPAEIPIEIPATKDIEDHNIEDPVENLVVEDVKEN